MAKFLNKNIKYIRNKKGISQQALADKIGIDRSTISRIENNEIDTTIDNAIDIAKALNIALPDLLGKDLTTDDYEIETPNNDISIMEKYRLLFDKDDRLTNNQKEFIMNFLEEQHKEVDTKLDSG